MIEFFYFLGIILLIRVFLALFISRQKQNSDKDLLIQHRRPERPTAPIKEKPINVVARSVYDVVGTYMDGEICRYVQLDDGRKFIFESIAVERSPGIYHADDIRGTYIIVDKYLLYREVPII